jgi:hypothetical protein
MLFVVVFLVLGAPAIVVGEWTIYKLVHLEHERHRAQWEADGRPEGTWWYPGKYPRLWRGLTKERTAAKWVRATPSWAREDPEALRLLGRLRICTASSLAAAAIALATQLLLG